MRVLAILQDALERTPPIFIEFLPSKTRHAFSGATQIEVVIEIVTKIEIEIESESESEIETQICCIQLSILSSNLFFIKFQVSRL